MHMPGRVVFGPIRWADLVKALRIGLCRRRVAGGRGGLQFTKLKPDLIF